MACLYTFDKAKAINNWNYLSDSAALSAMEKALLSKKIPQTHVDKFKRSLKGFNCSPLLQAASDYIDKNTAGQGLKQHINPFNPVHTAVATVVYGPQRLVLAAKFDLSVHLKGANLELQHTDCKGSTKVLLSVAP